MKVYGQLEAAQLENLSSDPTAVAGRIYYDTTNNVAKYYDSGASAWRTLVNTSNALINPMTTTGDIIYSSDGSGTPARLAIGGSGTVLHGGTTPSYSAVSLTADITGTLAVGHGGTGLTSGTSGGIPYFDSTSTLASSGALTASRIVLGGGAGSAPTSLAFGTANQVLGMNSGATAYEHKTFAVGTSGSDFAVAHTANTITFNLPDASASNRGAMTTGTQTIAGAKTWTGIATFSSAISHSASVAGDWAAQFTNTSNSGSSDKGVLVKNTNTAAILFQCVTGAQQWFKILGDGTTTFNTLAGSGSRAVNANASGDISAASDSRLKREITDVALPGLAEILQMRPVAYKWLKDIKERGESAAVEVGFFADEVAHIIPSAAPMGWDGYYGFYDRSVTAALVASIKELHAKIAALEAKQ